MTNICSARDCDRPTQDMLCTGSLTELVTSLRRIAFELGGHDNSRRPGLYEDLLDTVAHLDAIGGQSVGWVSGDGERPLPFHVAASDLRHQADGIVSTWARDFAETYTHLTLTARSTPQAAEWLATFPGLLAEHPAAGELHSDITGLEHRLRRMVDRAPDKVYLGKCEAEIEGQKCPEDLYAIPGRDMATCRTCGSHWDVREKRDWALCLVEDQLRTAAEVSKALSRLSYPVTTSMIRGYVHRGKLTQHPPAQDDASRRPLYRIGDVLDLLHSDQREAS